mgnify:CR=1 FL=1
MLSKILDKISNELNLEDFTRLNLVKRSVPAKELLVDPNKNFRSIYFIEKGVIRKFYISNSGKEHTTTFCFEGGFASPVIDIYLNRNPSFYIEALTDVIIHEFSYDEFKSILNELGLVDKVLSKLFVSLCIEMEEREKMLLTLDAIEKVKWFYSNMPNTVEDIPKNIISTYLDMDPSTFSRALKKLEKWP